MTSYTTITVREETKKRLNEHRDGKKWDVYLEELRREYADPMTLSEAEAIAEYIAERLEEREE